MQRPPTGGANTASTSTGPNLVYLGDRNEPADLPDRARLGRERQQRQGAVRPPTGYPPFDGDTPFTDLRYISGTLRGGKR